ncbi:MAG TPA: signal recognition particle-docking protein FtsY, partial [Myxococcales bacterium LLY-WYZ-16_1]|nr:signal recognition particle-docking protein FtsY [Myxococcales bacterium LLY-WYZ-16_1]
LAMPVASETGEAAAETTVGDSAQADAPSAEPEPAAKPTPRPKAKKRARKKKSSKTGTGQAQSTEAPPSTAVQPVSQPAAEAPAPPAAEAPEKPAATLRSGLAKTRKGFMARLNDLLFSRSSVDEDLFEEMEALLVTADMGVRTSTRLLEALRNTQTSDPEAVRSKLQELVRGTLELECPPLPSGGQPTVLMVIGVNGVGKTTTIGKLASQFTGEGKRVMLAAGDTFRAAAVEQLQVWGERAGAEVVRGPDKADPSSVVYEAVQRARREGFDVCICDTAGRLHTKVNLMEELKKVRRTMDKAHSGSPHEVMLVLDATTGQNAITQAKQFKEAVDVQSIALTKLDGTAKGGVVVAICDELQIPVRFVGVGEGIADLRPFDPDAFVDALFERPSTND